MLCILSSMTMSGKICETFCRSINQAVIIFAYFCLACCYTLLVGLPFVVMEPFSHTSVVAGLHKGILLAASADNAPLGDAGNASGSAVAAPAPKHPNQVQTRRRLRQLQHPARVLQAVLRSGPMIVCHHHRQPSDAAVPSSAGSELSSSLS